MTIERDGCLADLATWIAPVPADLRCEQADAYLRAHPELDTLVAELPDGSLAALTRLEFYTSLTGELGYGWSMHARRPLRSLLGGKLAPVDAGQSIAAFGQGLLDSGGAGARADVVVRDAAGRIGTVRVSDVFVAVGSLLRRQSEILDLMVTTDDLTGLANRLGINRYIASTIVERDDSGPAATGGDDADGAAAVVFIDLDHFKHVNDVYGHYAGDDVLCQFAERIRGVVRPGDFIGRLAGDEFIVVCPGAESYEHAVQIARRIQVESRRPFHLSEGSVGLSASIGVVVATPGDSVDETLRNADLAMYRAKTKGAGRVHKLRPGERATALRATQLEVCLPQAIAAGEIRAHYQPIFTLDERTTVGFEALARWNLDGEPVPPVDFVAVAERLGLMGPLTDLMVRHAGRDIPVLQSCTDASDAWVSVNVSARHASTRSFVDQVRRVLAEFGLARRSLVVEVTETVMFERIELIRSRLDQLTEMGVAVMLDDFGSGYSSLSPLTDLPLAGLKVDRTIVAKAQHSERLRTVLRGVFDFARVHGLETVAEGLERDRDVALLGELGCGLGQGFVVGRPQPLEELVAGGTSRWCGDAEAVSSTA